LPALPCSSFLAAKRLLNPQLSRQPPKQLLLRKPLRPLMPPLPTLLPLRLLTPLLHLPLMPQLLLPLMPLLLRQKPSKLDNVVA
jgi:hypothetical protein